MRYLFPIIFFLAACGLSISCNVHEHDGENADRNCIAFILHNFGSAKTTHSCQSLDTDNDGYVTCTVFVTWAEGTRPTVYDLQCSSRENNSGCKMTQPKLKVNSSED